MNTTKGPLLWTWKQATEALSGSIDPGDTVDGCKLQVCETVFLSPIEGSTSRSRRRKPSSWIFTNKEGTVSRRRIPKASTSWGKIYDRFMKISTSSKAGKDDKVCTVFMENNTSLPLDEMAFRAIISGGKRDGSLASVIAIQSYQLGESIRESTVHAKVDAETEELNIQIDGNESKIPDNINSICERIVVYLKCTLEQRILEFQVKVLTDDEGNVYIKQLTKLLLAPRLTIEPPATPEVSELYSPTKSLPEKVGETHFDLTGIINHGESTCCQGDFCSLPTETSNSLSVIDQKISFEPFSLVPGVKAEKVWRKCLSRVRSAASSQGKKATEESSVVERGPVTGSVLAKDIVLARAEMHYISGSVQHTDKSMSDPKKLAKSWKSYDLALGLEFDHRYPDMKHRQIPVCAECMCIYKRIQSLRQSGFKVNIRPSTVGSSWRQRQTTNSNTAQRAPTAPSAELVRDVDSRQDDEEGYSIRLRINGENNDQQPSQKAANQLSPSTKVPSNVIDVPKQGDFFPAPDNSLFDSDIGPQQPEDAMSIESSSKESRAASRELLQLHMPGRTVGTPDTVETLPKVYGASKSSFGKNTEVFPARGVRDQEPEESMPTPGTGSSKRGLLSRLSSSSSSVTSERQRRSSDLYVPPADPREVFQLKQQLDNMYSRLLQEQENSSKQSRELRSLKNKLAHSQQEWLRAMKEMEETCDRKVVELERQHHNHIANLSQMNPMKESKAIDAAQAQTEQLMATVETLNEKLKKQQEDSIQARKLLEAQNNEEIERMEQDHESELEMKTLQEKRLLAKSKQMEAELFENEKLRAAGEQREAQLKKRFAAMEREKAKLESAHQTLREEMLQLSERYNRQDELEDSTRASQDSKMKQLSNEVQFLQLQLRSETQCKEELTATLGEVNRKFAQAKEDWKRSLAKATQARDEEVLVLTHRLEEAIAIPKSETANLKTQVQQLQTLVSGLTKDAEINTKKLEIAEQAYSKLVKEKGQLVSERDALAATVSEMEETVLANKRGEDIDGAIRSTTEAAIRRLENEIEYLKSQLSVERSCKEELESKVDEGKRTLSQTIEQWTRKLFEQERDFQHRLRELRESESHLVEKAIEKDSQLVEAQEELRKVKGSLEETKRDAKKEALSVMQLKKQVSDLKAQLSRQLHALEQEQAEMTRLREAQKFDRMALESKLKQEKQNSELHLESVRDQLQEAHKKLSDTHLSLLEVKDESSLKEDALRRDLACYQISNTLKNRIRLNQSQALWRWMNQVSIEKTEEELHDDMESQTSKIRIHYDTLQIQNEEELIASHRRQLSQQLATQKFKMEEIHTEALQMAREDTFGQLSRSRNQFNQVLRASLEKARNAHESSVINLQETYQCKVNQLMQKHSEDLTEATSRAEQTKKKELSSQKKKLEKTFREELQRLQELHVSEVGKLKSDAQHHLESTMSKLESEKLELLSEIKDRCAQDSKLVLKSVQQAAEQEQQTLREEHSKELEALEGKLKTKYALELDIFSKASVKDTALAVEEAKKACKEEEKLAIIELETQFEETLIENGKAHERELGQLRTQMDELRKLGEENLLKKHAQELKEQKRLLSEKQTEAMKENTAKWQTVVSECVAEGKKKLQETVAAKEAAFQEATQTLKESCEIEKKQALQDLEELHKATQDAERIQFQEKMMELESQLKRDSSEIIQGKLVQLQQQHEEKLAKLKAEFQEAEERKELEWATRLESNKEQLNQERNDALSMQAKVSVEREQKLRQSIELESKESLERLVHAAEGQRERIQREHEMEKENLEVEHKQKLESSLAALHSEHQDEMRETKEELVREMNFKVKEVERTCDQLLKDKAARNLAIEAELKETRSTLEESEDMVYDLQVKVKQLQQSGAVQRLQQIIWQLKAVSVCSKEKEMAVEAANSEFVQSTIMFKKQINSLRERLENVELILSFHEETQREMEETVMHHKREVLIEHRLESSVLQSEMVAISEQLDIFDSNRSKAAKELSTLEGQIKQIELQTHELSKISTIENGRINVAHARKKRKLDQEFDRVLELASNKRTELAAIENQVKDLVNMRTEKEDKLKDLESDLVRILVEQQKKLLGVLQKAKNNVKSASKEIRAKEKTQSRRKVDSSIQPTGVSGNDVKVPQISGRSSTSSQNQSFTPRRSTRFTSVSGIEPIQEEES